MADGKGEKSRFSAGCGVVADKTGEYGAKALFRADSQGDLEEREAIQAIDGEGALCIHCGKFMGLNELSIPYDGRELHQRCHDAHFGFERQEHSEPP